MPGGVLPMLPTVTSGRRTGRRARLFTLAALTLASGCTSESELISQSLIRNDLQVHVYSASIDDGISVPINFNVPKDTKSMLIEVRGDRGMFSPLKFKTPPPSHDLVESGELVSREARLYPGLVQWMYPNRPGLTVTPGDYALTIYAEDSKGNTVSEDIGVHIYLKSKTTYKTCGVHLDILFDQDAIDVDDFEQAAEDFVTKVNSFYSKKGIIIIDYSTQHLPLTPDVSVEGTSAIRTVGTMLNQARSQGSARDGAIHVMLVDKIGGTSATSIDPSGYSLGLPGAYDAGLLSSNVLLATSKFTSGGKLNSQGIANTFCHELGHYLGLFHTSEADYGTAEERKEGKETVYRDPHDPYSDTPECNGTLFSCDSEFNLNIMSPSAGSFRTILTPQQVEMINNHPTCIPMEVEVTEPPVTVCELECDSPETCALFDGSPTCRPACDDQDAESCTAGKCQADDLGMYVCN